MEICDICGTPMGFEDMSEYRMWFCTTPKRHAAEWHARSIAARCVPA